jgi:hypothetical protein
MKIIFLSARDTGGTTYTLAHAINRVTPEHQAVNIRGINTFIAYPTIMDMADYPRSAMKKMILGADVVVFLELIHPFTEAYGITRKELKDVPKKILLEMGSEWRYGRRDVLEQAERILGDYKVVLGGADMFQPIDFKDPEGNDVHFDAVDESTVEYLPVVRGFDEIQEKYGISKPDQVALESFACPRKKVIFTHAPTSEVNKGSHIFFKAITRAQQAVPNLVFTTVRQQTWHATLGIIAKSDVLLDQAPPFPTAYGALSVEAGIFRLPSFSQVAPECRDFIKRHTGLNTPQIAFNDDEDLFKKVTAIATDAELRHEWGNRNYEYCKQLHDEKPVVDRFLKIVEAM